MTHKTYSAGTGKLFFDERIREGLGEGREPPGKLREVPPQHAEAVWGRCSPAEFGDFTFAILDSLGGGVL